MNIIKRDGTSVPYNKNKIARAITLANKDTISTRQISEDIVAKIVNEVDRIMSLSNRSFAVEEIQNLVEEQLMHERAFDVARNYMNYRYQHELRRQANSTDDQILSLIECANEEVKDENSNKNPTIVSVQRDYMAGETSKDLTKRILLPADVWKAHEEGLIHFHDADYFAQHMHNCCLVNLEDMLQNGTVISETMIEKPHSFYTACNVTTQIVAQVASSQYGLRTAV